MSHSLSFGGRRCLVDIAGKLFDKSTEMMERGELKGSYQSGCESWYLHRDKSRGVRYAKRGNYPQ